MNYNYSYTFPDGSAAELPRFSRGEQGDMNPSNMSEADNYSGSTVAKYLTNEPWEFDEETTDSDVFDWNRDGKWDLDVRAQVAHVPGFINYGGAELPMVIGQGPIAAGAVL